VEGGEEAADRDAMLVYYRRELEAPPLSPETTRTLANKGPEKRK